MADSTRPPGILAASEAAPTDATGNLSDDERETANRAMRGHPLYSPDAEVPDPPPIPEDEQTRCPTCGSDDPAERLSWVDGSGAARVAGDLPCPDSFHPTPLG
jgi:hypothetical protein